GARWVERAARAYCEHPLDAGPPARPGGCSPKGRREGASVAGAVLRRCERRRASPERLLQRCSTRSATARGLLQRCSTRLATARRLLQRCSTRLATARTVLQRCSARLAVAPSAVAT